MHLTRHNNERTCAGLDALKPRVIKLRVAGIAALVDPSTAGKATTNSFAGFVRGALRTEIYWIVSEWLAREQ